LKRIAAFGATAALVLAGMLVLESGLKARAQSESQAGRIEGTWRVQLTVRNCQTGEPLRSFPALFTFAKGGTLTATTAGQSPALFSPNLGLWVHTDGNTYSAVSEAFVLAPPEPGYRHTGSRVPSSSVATRTSSPTQLRLKSSTPTVT